MALIQQPHQSWFAVVLAAGIALGSTPAVAALEGKDLPEPEIDDLTLYMPNSSVAVSLENGSKSGKLSDFLLKINNFTLSLKGMSGVLHCGKHGATAVRTAPDPINGSKNRNGAPAIHFGIVDKNHTPAVGALYTLKDPGISITTFSRSNKLNTQGYVKYVNGSPWDFNIPVSKLKKAGNLGSVDIQGEFDNRMNAFIANGGSKIDFLRKDHDFDMSGFVTLQAGCYSQMNHFGYHTKSFTIKVHYKGDKTLKYSASIPTAGNGAVQQALHVKSLNLQVTPPQSVQNCPYDVTARANITFNHSPSQATQYKVRFIEDGKPISKWMTKVLQGTNSAIVTHKIAIDEPNELVEKPNQRGKAFPARSFVVCSSLIFCVAFYYSKFSHQSAVLSPCSRPLALLRPFPPISMYL